MAGQIYKLVHEQLVPRKLEEVFDFFSRAENLETLTPDFMHFKIVSVSPQPVQKGTLIKYKLRVRGLPLHWTSEIREWDPPNPIRGLPNPWSLQALASHPPVHCGRQ
jgi:ligand-binding SRPBCC domain-containing protein